jgi:uncharacterized protein YjbI with pentapeptide repeats
VGRKKSNREQTEETKQSRWGFRGTTVRDWLPIVGALLIPVVIAAGTWGITWQQGKIEDQRAKAERELAEQRAQDEALQAYLDQMSNLLLERNLREAAKDSEVSTLARARTLTVLSRLDSARKQRLVQFLYEAGLLHQEKPVIDLTGADLSGIDLHLNNLSGGGTFMINVARTRIYSLDRSQPRKAANLSGAILSDANLEDAVLNYTDLSEADLRDANLRNATLHETDLFSANLSDADLSHALLGDADLALADLSGADLSHALLGGADLSYADLSDADLSHADLRSDLDLSDADLSNANLNDANLNDASGITNEELEQQARSLKGATMPNGQKYEDWLKDKKAQGKDEKKE